MVIPVTRIDKEREREAEYKKGGYPRGNLTIGEERKISFGKTKSAEIVSRTRFPMDARIAAGSLAP